MQVKRIAVYDDRDNAYVLANLAGVGALALGVGSAALVALAFAEGT